MLNISVFMGIKKKETGTDSKLKQFVMISDALSAHSAPDYVDVLLVLLEDHSSSHNRRQRKLVRLRGVTFMAYMISMWERLSRACVPSLHPDQSAAA